MLAKPCFKIGQKKKREQKNKCGLGQRKNQKLINQHAVEQIPLSLFEKLITTWFTFLQILSF